MEEGAPGREGRFAWSGAELVRRRAVGTGHWRGSCGVSARSVVRLGSAGQLKAPQVEQGVRRNVSCGNTGDALAEEVGETFESE